MLRHGWNQFQYEVLAKACATSEPNDHSRIAALLKKSMALDAVADAAANGE
ncbi:hypothetical protein JCM19000A_20770 [Silvimonas sp. JCM 19000]